MAMTDIIFRFGAQENETPEGGEELVQAHFDWQGIRAQFEENFLAFQENFISWGSLWQAIAVLGAILLGYILSRYPAGRIRKMVEARPQRDIIHRLLSSCAQIIWPAFTVILLWIATAVFGAINLPIYALRVAASLLNAWIVVRFVTSNMKPGFWQTFVASLAWIIAALYILHLLEPVISALNSAAFTVAGVQFTVYRIIQSILIAIFALWIGRLAGDAAQSQLAATKNLNPSIAGLLGQVLKIGFMTVAILFALSSLGVNLTALTVFGGALGVGIGFGLQAIFSNFISGIIILFERSVKVGDFIELQSGVTGLVNEINIRSTLVTTNDNVDILVPNEEFIKAQVINWTLRDARRRSGSGLALPMARTRTS